MPHFGEQKKKGRWPGESSRIVTGEFVIYPSLDYGWRENVPISPMTPILTAPENICSEQAPLALHHTPPPIAGKASQLQLRRLFKLTLAEEPCQCLPEPANSRELFLLTCNPTEEVKGGSCTQLLVESWRNHFLLPCGHSEVSVLQDRTGCRQAVDEWHDTTRSTFAAKFFQNFLWQSLSCLFSLERRWLRGI